MASKKEHKRKQKSKNRSADGAAGRDRIAYPEKELNSLNLLSSPPRPADAQKSDESRAAATAAAPDAHEPQMRPDGESGQVVTREMEEQAALRASEYAEDGDAPEGDAHDEGSDGNVGEDAEKSARAMAEEAEKARRETEAAEQRVREAAERAEREAASAAAAGKPAESAEEAGRVLERAAPGRPETDIRESAGRGSESGREPDPRIMPPPPLEVENPYWEKSPQIFEMLSGAPHPVAGSPYGESPYGGGESFPVTMAEGPAAEQGAVFASSGYEEEYVPEENRTMPVPEDKRLYIVMVTPEVAPCAKVGGLGDVILGLGRELMKRGHGVEVICPMYSGMRYDLIYDLHEEYGELWSPHYNEWRSEKVFQGKVEGGLQVNFITGGTYTERPDIYGYDDDLQRFTYFSRQALEFMFKTNRRPDVIHCHDWATGLVPAILWDVYQKLGWDNSRVVYTIHNNECQGLCGFGDKLLSMVGLDIKNYLRPDRMQDDAHRNCINMMKAGIVYSNFVTTVSPTYAGELKSAVGGRGLQHTVAKNSAKIGGVLNGIDYDSWNPQTDGKLTARYSVGEDFFEKYQNKKALREWLGLYDAWRPIVSVVTRLTQQKGLDLIKAAIFQTLELEGQFVLLGSAPDPKVNADFVRLQHELRDNHDVNLYIGYHEDLSRLIYAGSDMFLIPSLYEPCGLTQMISLRYGTVPIVRETGGLLDTVFDLENSGRGLNNANGFTFRDPNPQSLKYGLERAIRLWYNNPEAFNRLARNGMRYDYSWRHPAEHYENIYNYIKA